MGGSGSRWRRTERYGRRRRESADPRQPVRFFDGPVTGRRILSITCTCEGLPFVPAARWWTIVGSLACAVLDGLPDHRGSHLGFVCGYAGQGFGGRVFISNSTSSWKKRSIVQGVKNVDPQAAQGFRSVRKIAALDTHTALSYTGLMADAGMVTGGAWNTRATTSPSRTMSSFLLPPVIRWHYLGFF